MPQRPDETELEYVDRIRLNAIDRVNGLAEQVDRLRAGIAEIECVANEADWRSYPAALHRIGCMCSDLLGPAAAGK